MLALSPSPASNELYEVSGSAETRKVIVSRRSSQVSPLKSPSYSGFFSRTISWSVRGADMMYGPLPIMIPFSQSFWFARSSTSDGIGHEQLEAGHRVEVGVGLGQRDLEGHRVVVGHDTGDLVGLTVEDGLATLDEGADQVAVVTGEVRLRGPVPGPRERAGQDRLTGGELLALPDGERPHRGVLVGLVGLGHVGHDHGVVRIRGVDVGQPVVEGVDDLVGVQGGVQRGVDVLGWVTHEGAEVDEVAARRRRHIAVATRVVTRGVVTAVVTATGRHDQHEGDEDGGQTAYRSLQSHRDTLPISSDVVRTPEADGPQVPAQRSSQVTREWRRVKRFLVMSRH